MISEKFKHGYPQKMMRLGFKINSSILFNRHVKISIPLAGGKGLSSHGNAEIEIVFKDSQSDETKACSG